jgi:chromosome segregation ATPase
MYTLKEAAEACGRGKTAILKSIQKGRISAQKNPLGEWEIDPAELHRVYPPMPKAVVNNSESERQEVASSALELAVIKEKVAALEAQLEREREVYRELSRRLDQSEAERRETQGKLTALLTYQHQPAPEEALPPTANEGKGGFWEKLFGNSKK